MIISVGYRVKSNRGEEFRKWANKVLKQYQSVFGRDVYPSLEEGG